MKYIYRPIDMWPGKLTPAGSRKSAKFNTAWPKTLLLLEREIDHLRNWQQRLQDVVFQLALTELDFRNDGMPRAHAKPEHPGVMIAFESIHGPLRYATDTYDDWQDNVRAIALALEALRAVDRYGVSKRGEQYKGWQGLPSAAEDMTLTEARDLIGKHGGLRAAQYATHPDHGGNQRDFNRVMVAKRIIEAAS